MHRANDLILEKYSIVLCLMEESLKEWSCKVAEIEKPTTSLDTHSNEEKLRHLDFDNHSKQKEMAVSPTNDINTIQINEKVVNLNHIALESKANTMHGTSSMQNNIAELDEIICMTSDTLFQCSPDPQKSFECPVCGRKCIKLSSFNAHMISHTGEKPFHCNVCDYKCKILGNLKIHMRVHSNGNPFKSKWRKYADP